MVLDAQLESEGKLLVLRFAEGKHKINPNNAEYVFNAHRKLPIVAKRGFVQVMRPNHLLPL